MATWLLVYGVGGCWSGYTDATIIEAPEHESAWSQGLQIAWRETAERRGRSRGCSFDLERVNRDVRTCLLYRSRCKPEARKMAELAFDAKAVAHG